MSSLLAPVSEPLQVPALSIRGLSKSFVGKTVLDNVSFDIAAGEIVGLLGQNGSGKSTLIKVLAGYHAPDPESAVYFNGQSDEHGADHARPGDPGMAFVHQNLGLFDGASVLDNLLANRWARVGGHISWPSLRKSARKLLADFELDVDIEQVVGGLSQGDKAVLAIARAVDELADAPQGLLVLDEPTPYLGRDEVQRLFIAMRAAADRRLGILFVSHRLQEVREVTDRVVVIRDGRVVADRRTDRSDDQELIELIVGTPRIESAPRSTGLADQAVESVLRVHELTLVGGAKFSFDLRPGEIIGLTGLLGSGFEDIPYILAGAQQGCTGRMDVDGVEVDLSRLDPPRAIALGLALVPADRNRLAIFGAMSVSNNMSAPWIDRLRGRWRIDRRTERQQVGDLLRRFDVRPRDPAALMETLSGGNQQKVVLARWIANGPRVLLLHEPTQGVDIGARQHIASVIKEAALHGMAVIYASLEFEELAEMCDRVHVFRDREAIAELIGPDITATRMIDLSISSATGHDMPPSSPSPIGQAT